MRNQTNKANIVLSSVSVSNYVILAKKRTVKTPHQQNCRNSHSEDGDFMQAGHSCLNKTRHASQTENRWDLSEGVGIAETGFEGPDSASGRGVWRPTMNKNLRRNDIEGCWDGRECEFLFKFSDSDVGLYIMIHLEADFLFPNE